MLHSSGFCSGALQSGQRPKGCVEAAAGVEAEGRFASVVGMARLLGENLIHRLDLNRKTLTSRTKTHAPSLREIAHYVDEFLDIKNVADWPNALNGLQV